MDFARNLRGFCVGFARNLILFLFEREHEGYKRFADCTVHHLGPRSRNDLDLQYSHTFINFLSCLLLPTFRLLVAIVSEKSTVFTFSYGKAQITKFDLVVK